MGYVEQIMGDSEQVVYRTHQHAIVLLQRTVGWLFAFLVFVGLGLVVFFAPQDEPGTKIRFIIGLIILVSLVMPLYLIISAWMQGQRGREFLTRIWQPALAGTLILIVALVLMLNPDARYVGWIALALSLIALVELVRTFLDWLNERYIITNRRVIEVKGTINKHTSDSALEKVNDVRLNQSVVGRVLGYGTVEIITGSDIGANVFRRISNPVRFKRAMLNAKEQLHTNTLPASAKEESPALEIEDAVGEPTPAAADIPDLILELDELRQKGILSEEEFQAKKSDLLDRL
ncbi:PH domain-containing protein [Chloroflexota bacterium]